MANKPREALYKKRREVWREILYDTRGHEKESVAAKRLELVELWRKDWWAYLCGRDVPTEEHPFGYPVVWTVDERDDSAPIKPFPSDKLYLREIGEEMWTYRLSFVDKIRQKYLTTFACQLLDWYAAFNEEREILVSRVKEASAIKMINDKIRTVYTRKPKWLQEVMKINMQPRNVITYAETGSTITGVAQNFASSDARGVTASLILVDEAAYQEFFKQIYSAIQPMAARLWAVTTANIGNEGAAFFKECVFEGRPSAEQLAEMKGAPGTNLKVYRDGLYSFTTPKGIRATVLRIGADPAETPENLAALKRSYPSQKDWRREMEGDWSSPAGEPYFPVFSELGQERYVRLATELIAGPVYRSYDFGRRHPACTWFQYSPKSDRLWLLREFMPHDLLTHEFRDAVRFLSGQLDIGQLTDRTRVWIDRYRNRLSGQHCPPPWFPPGTIFIDLSGKEVVQSSGNALSPDEATAKDIFAAGGIFVMWVAPDVKGRNRVVERMLMEAPDGWPRTLIDPQCEEMLAGFNGAFAYPEKTTAVPIPDQPKDDGYYINLLDAWGYGVCSVVPKEAPEAPKPRRLLGWDGRTPVYSDPEPVAQIGWRLHA